MLPTLLGDVKPPLGPGKLGRSAMMRYISGLPVPICHNQQGEDCISYPDLLRLLSIKASPPNLVHCCCCCCCCIFVVDVG